MRMLSFRAAVVKLSRSACWRRASSACAARRLSALAAAATLSRAAWARAESAAAVRARRSESAARSAASESAAIAESDRWAGRPPPSPSHTGAFGPNSQLRPTWMPQLTLSSAPLAGDGI